MPPFIQLALDHILESCNYTLSDYLAINAQAIASFNSAYRCSEKRKDAAKPHDYRIAGAIAKNFTPEQVEALCKQRDKSLDKMLEQCKNKRVQFEGYTLKGCFCQHKHPLFFKLFQMNEARKKGILPFSGGWQEQPAQIMSLIDIAEEAIAREQVKEEEKQYNEMNKKK